MKKSVQAFNFCQNINLSSGIIQFINPPLWSESSLLFGGRKGRYLPLKINNVNGLEEIPYRVVMLGDYDSGISLLRSEMIQLKSFKDIPFSDDAECCTTIMRDGHEMQMWLFVDLHSFELFCKQCTESIDCCIACYSIAITKTYQHVVEKWIPEFVNKFPGKPIILCALNDREICTCGGGIDETMFKHDFNFCNSRLTQIDVSIFNKRSVKSLYDCIKNASSNSKLKQREENKMNVCILM